MLGVTPTSKNQPTTWPTRPPGAGGLYPGFQNIGGVWGNNLPPGVPQLNKPAATSTPGASGAPQPGVGAVQGPITPQSIYTPQMTAQGVNQAVAQNAPDSYEALKSVGNQRGISRGPQTAAQANAVMQNNVLAGNQAAGTIPLLDYIANERNKLAGEQSASDYGFDSAGLLSRLQSVRDKQYFGNADQQMSLLQSLLGSI